MNKLRTLRGWVVQNKKSKELSFIFVWIIHLPKNDLNTVKVIFCDVIIENKNVSYETKPKYKHFQVFSKYKNIKPQKNFDGFFKKKCHSLQL